MANFIVSICLAAALCYFVEGATKSDLLGSITRNGVAVRQESTYKVREATIPSLVESVPPTQTLCVLNLASPALKELYKDIAAVQTTLRLEAKNMGPKELAALTVAELDAKIKRRIQDAVNPNLKKNLDAIAKCSVTVI